MIITTRVVSIGDGLVMNNQSQEPKNQAEPKLKVFVADDRKVSSENENVNAGKRTVTHTLKSMLIRRRSKFQRKFQPRIRSNRDQPIR